MEHEIAAGGAQVTELVGIADALGGDAHAERLMSTYFDVHKAILGKRHEYVKKFGKIMSSVKVMRFFQLENKVEAEVNAALAVTIPLADPR